MFNWSSTNLPRTYNGKRNASSIYGAGKTGYPTCRRIKLNPYFTSYTEINSKLIKNLNGRLETIKRLEEYIGNIGKLSWNWSEQWFLNMTQPKSQVTKAKINQWDYIKLKTFCTANEILNRVKKQAMEWGKIANPKSEKDLIFKIYKEHLKLNSKKAK